MPLTDDTGHKAGLMPGVTELRQSGTRIQNAPKITPVALSVPGALPSISPSVPGWACACPRAKGLLPGGKRICELGLYSRVNPVTSRYFGLFPCY